MGPFVAAAAIVVSMITSVVAAVAAVVATVVTAVIAAVTAIATVIGGTIATVVGAVTAVASGVFSSISAVVFPILAKIKVIGIVAYNAVSSVVGTMVATFQSFAEAIHLKTLLEIHSIAQLVSKDYRAMLQKVYSRISDVSSQLGLGPQFLNLAFRNARVLTLSVSSILGRKYDLGEVAWINQWNSALLKFQGRVQEFERNPEAVFDFIDQEMLKDSVDAAAGSMLTVYTTIQNTLSVIKTTVNDVNMIRHELDKFVGDLPSFIRKRVEPMIDPYFEKYDKFISMEYQPRMTEFNRIVDSVGDTLDLQMAEISDVVDRLKRPGDIMISVDDLEPSERHKQEDRISSVVFRGYGRTTGVLEGESSETHMELKRLALALQRKAQPPVWKVPELETPSRPADTPIEPRSTWFVGDH